MSYQRLISIISAWCLLVLTISGQAPAGYYDSANGLTGTALQQALHNIIDNHTSLTYTDLWTAFKTTDKKSDGSVWDMYSDKPSGTPAYTYTFVTDQCGTYSKEGDCYNREHSFPKSWFGGEVSPMYTDLFHLYPTDGYVNGKRSNYAFGEVSSSSWTSSNGSKLGPSSVSGFTGTVFEPIDEYKGDFARSYFYMATRYYGEDSSWPGSDMVDGAEPKAWALAMLLQWHRDDPVSQKETDRNNAVYALQHNRNPYIDYPLYVEMVWGTMSSSDDLRATTLPMNIFPNPATEKITIELSEETHGERAIQLYDINGCLVKTITSEELSPVIDITSLTPGYYLIQVTSGSRRFVSRLAVVR